MPDITMCGSIDCPSKEDCLRYMAKPDLRYQSYALFYEPGESCDNFIPLDGE